MYGPYIDAVSVNVDNPAGAQLALKGVRTMVCLGRLGSLLTQAEKVGVEQVRWCRGGGDDVSDAHLGQLAFLSNSRNSSIAKVSLRELLLVGS